MTPEHLMARAMRELVPCAHCGAVKLGHGSASEVYCWKGEKLYKPEIEWENRIRQFIMSIAGDIGIPIGWEFKTRECWGGERLTHGDWSVWQEGTSWALKQELREPIFFGTRNDALWHALLLQGENS